MSFVPTWLAQRLDFQRALPSRHFGAAHDAISAELVRLSLPHHPSTDRPELRVQES